MDHGATKSALYIDFDNFFGGLISADPRAALVVAQNPAVWLERLRSAHSAGSRRWLVLRCYMNPAGWVQHPTLPSERLFFSKFRPFFSQAGFEIVDCPSLTRGSKNGADIRMTVDIMNALRATTRYDEVVIASSDSDFTHLLQVVRADDRRILMIATSGTAVAYQALADTYLDEQDVLDLMRDPDEEQGMALSGDHPQPQAVGGTVPPDGGAPLAAGSLTGPQQADSVDWKSFSDAVRETYLGASEPINLARWSSDLIAQFGQRLRSESWFGTGGFARALGRVGLEGLAMSQRFAWDTSRHEAPNDPDAVDLPPGIARFCQIVGLPRIPSDQWPVLFRALEAYAQQHDYQLTESTRWSRDHAAQEGANIPRSAFSYVVRGCSYGGAPLNAEPPPNGSSIGEAFLASVLEGASKAGLDVDDEDSSELRSWLRLDDLNNPGSWSSFSD